MGMIKIHHDFARLGDKLRVSFEDGEYYCPRIWDLRNVLGRSHRVPYTALTNELDLAIGIAWLGWNPTDF